MIQCHTDEVGVEYACRLRVYEGHRKPVVVVAEPLPGSPPLAPVAGMLAEMVFGMVEESGEQMWWIERVLSANLQRSGNHPDGEQWRMAWVDEETVKGAIASPADHLLAAGPVDPEMVRMMILPNRLTEDNAIG